MCYCMDCSFSGKNRIWTVFVNIDMLMLQEKKKGNYEGTELVTKKEE